MGRISERLMYFLGICLAITYGLELFYFSFFLVCAIILTTFIGAALEGLRIYQFIFLIAFVPHIILVVLDIFSFIALAIYCTFLGCAIVGNLIFGEGNLDRIKMTGPYEVGHIDIYCSKHGTAISCYYPIDRQEHDKKAHIYRYNTLWLRNGYCSLLGVARATATWGEAEPGLGPWFYKYLEYVYMNTVQRGKVAEEFKDGRKVLIPIIFSHGLTCNRTTYSGICRDFASHGYIVFAIDHYDGTAYYSRLFNGRHKYWSSNHDFKDYQLRLNQLEQRKEQVIGFIDDLHSPDYLQKTCHLPEGVSMDLEKLLMTGHSFGGMTSLMMAHEDKRIKGVFTMDPWLWCRLEEIEKKEFFLTQPQFNIITEGFTPIVEEYFGYNSVDEMMNIMKNSTDDRKELLGLLECNHYHQCDAIIIIPLESFFKSYNPIQTNYVELYLIHSKTALDFFRRIGFHNSTDPDKDFADCGEQIKSLQGQYFDWVLQYKNEVDEEGGECNNEEMVKKEQNGYENPEEHQSLLEKE